jgi:hypothetical protein
VSLEAWRSAAPNRHWQVVLSTDEPRFQESGNPDESVLTIDDNLALRFARPASVILKGV